MGSGGTGRQQRAKLHSRSPIPLTATPPVRLALLAAAFVAFNPQFVFVSSAVSNDTLGAAVGAAGFLVLARGFQAGEVRLGSYLTLAALGVIGLLAKTSTLPPLAVTGLALLAIDGRTAKRRARDVAVAGALASLLAAPYLVWNATYRGDPLGMQAVWSSAMPYHTPRLALS